MASGRTLSISVSKRTSRTSRVSRDTASEFTRFDFDLTRLGQRKVSRVYYEVRVPQEAFLRFVLHEGADMQPLVGSDLLVGRKTTPYDAFAIWMHMSKRRFNSAQG